MEIISREDYHKDDTLAKAYTEPGIDVNFGITPIELINEAFDVLRVDENSYVVDIGCGDGRALRLAADRGAKVFGIECSQLRFKLAQQLLTRFSGTTLVNGDFRDVTIPKEVTHLFSFLWPGVTEAAIAHVQKTVPKFRGVSICHSLQNIPRTELKYNEHFPWGVYFYLSQTTTTSNLWPLPYS